MEIFDSGSGQNSDLGQEQLNNMEESAKADNTKRATKWGLNRFEEWQAKRRISFDWKTVSSKQRNDILRKFYAKVKTRKRNNTFTKCSQRNKSRGSSIDNITLKQQSDKYIERFRVYSSQQHVSSYASYITILETLNQHTKMQSRTET